MSTRHLFSVVLLAALVLNARASFYFTWNAPGAVNVGQNYTVGVQAYFTPSYSGDPYATLGLYRNGSQVGGGGTSAYGSATASNSFTDNSPQTVGYSADIYSYYGESDYSSHSVTVNGAPANNPPTAWVTVDGWSHGATVTRPYGGSVSVTVRYKASDPDNNLARIRPQVWHPSGYLNNNGGNFIGQSGGYGEVAWTVTLNENGNWHFWTDAEDTNNVFVNSGAWSAGFRLTVVEGAPPNTPPTVVLHSPSAQTIYLNQALTITSQATDPDNNIAHHNLDIQRPDGSWNWQGGFANGHPYTGGYNGSPGNSNRSASFTFNQLGTWYVRSAAADSSGWYHSATVAINVINVPDTTPPGAPANLQISNPTSSGFTASWTAPSGEAVTGYRVRLNSGGFTEVGNVLSHNFTGLTANTAYTVEVQARDAAGNWSSSASYGYSTGSGGSGGNQSSASVWMDVDNDGIRDEIMRPGSEAFTYNVGVWFTPVVQYASHPLNNFWFLHSMFYFGGTPADNFGRKFFDSSAQFYVTWSTRFGLVFDIQINANEPWAVYRDLTDSDQITPGNWEYIFGSTTGPAYTAMHEFFWEVPNPFQLVNSKYFAIKYGQSVSKVHIKDSNGNVLATNVGAGGTATINVPANGDLTIETITAGGQTIPIEEGKHGLTWVIDAVINGVNGVLHGAGKTLDLIGVTPLPNGQVVVKLKLDNDQEFTFVLILQNAPPIIEFRAKDGRINDGFDLPLAETQDSERLRVWHTSVAKTAPHNVNDVVKLVFSSATLAEQYELVVPAASEPHVDISPKQFTSAQTDLTITGKNGGGGRVEAEILLRKKSNGSVFGKLIVDVMPWREIGVKIFKLQPGSVLSRGQITSALPSLELVQNELNARFKQACVSFSISATIESEYFDYDNGPADGVFQLIRWTNNGTGTPTASQAEVNNMITEAGRFDGQLNVVFVKLLGDTNTDATQFPETNQTTSSSTSGVNFFGHIPIRHIAFIAADYPNYQQSGAEDQFGAVRSVQRVIAHEVGHALGLSTREIVVSEILGITDNHDSETVPVGTRSLLRAGPSGPPGKWMRHEDWRTANDTAGGL